MNKLSSLLIIAGAALLSGCERAKTKLDREVDRLCAIDGGVKIYETVTLSPENFGPSGEVFPQYRHLTSKGGELGPDYYSRATRKTLVAGDPMLERVHIAIYRRQSNQMLGEAINYVRGGGDVPGPWPPSTHECQRYLLSPVSLNDVFVKESK